MKAVSKLHFITPQPSPTKAFYSTIEFLLSCGIDWLQYRNKLSTDEEFIKIGLQLQEVCENYNTTFIVNDRIHLAKQLHANGVHVGQKDASITTAKQLLGNDFIIGNSTNNYTEIETAQNCGADYVGLGPLQFTNTKDNLNPILGFNGYAQIVKKIAANKAINIPIVAIGGITKTEIIKLKEIGINHFAISSYLFQITDKKEIIELIKLVNN